MTHDQEEAFAVADRVMVINRGRLEQSGSPDEILDNPGTEFVARFIGEANVYEGQVRDGVYIGAVPTVGVPDGTAVCVVSLLRPQVLAR